MSEAVEDVERISERNHRLGEGPLWDYRENALYWLDIKGHSIQRYYPATGRQDIFDIGTAPGCIGLRAAGGFVLGTKQGLAFWNPSDNKLEIIANPEAGRSEMRFNDGAVDPQGRFWAGSMNENPQIDLAEGTLYRLDPDRSVRPMQDRVAISNGLGWSPDHRTMYFTDSPRKVIYAYDFDPASGAINNRRPLIDTSAEQGEPDGLTIDSEGCIWSARWGGWTVTRYDPAGRKLRVLRLPVEQPTSCAFGGPTLDELYITSATDGLDDAKRTQQPLSGALLRLRVGVKGVPANQFAG